MAAVEVTGLSVRYGELVAVNDVSFSAEAGQVTAVLGPNGAGKTSTIEVCEGYRNASAGTARVLGLDPATQQRLLSERMGVMLQQGGVYPSARVLATVRHYCALYGKGADARELVEQVGLTARSNSTWRRLSGGEQQRLSLALAMAARPEVAFLDEPTSGVDVNGRDTIRGIDHFGLFSTSQLVSIGMVVLAVVIVAVVVALLALGVTLRLHRGYVE